MLGLGNTVAQSFVKKQKSKVFNLADINSLQAWFKKGEGITTDGGNVSAWASQVGDFMFGQTVSSAQPVHDASTDIIQFTQARQLNLRTADNTSSASVTGGVGNAITVCMAMKVNVDTTSVNTKFQVVLGQANTVRIQMFLPGDFFYLGGASSTITMILPSGTFTDDEVALITWASEGGTNGNGRLFKNTSTTQINDPDTGTTGTISLSQLGNDGASGGRGLSSGVIEIAVFNEELTGDNLQSVLTDIATRAGI